MRLLSLIFIVFSNLSFAELASIDNRTIQITGSGVISSVPNLFSFSVRLEERGRQAKALNQSITATTRQAIKTLISLGVEKSSIQALQVRFTPWIEYKREGNEQKGFILTRKINVTLDKLELYDQAIDALLSIGITRIDGFSYSNSDADVHYDKALEQALINAKNRATSMVKTMGLKLGPIVSILEQSSNQFVRPVQFEMDSVRKNASYEPGKMNTHAKVQVVFILSDI